jgi:DNA-binding protein HU-beta
MTKPELVDIIATKTQTTKKIAEAMLNAYTEAIMEALSQGLNVQLIGFGTFKVRARAARVGRNPQTGKPINIPAKIVPVFRPGTRMKKAAAKTLSK